VNREEQMAFALMPMLDGTGPILTIGIPAAAWERIKDGTTHSIDLTKVGIALRVVLFGASTHDAAVEMLMQGAKAAGVPVLDERRRDFSFDPGAKS
jgi:hypothetical protein